MRIYIAQELKYPEEALKNKKEGTVRLRYDIDYKGNVFDAHIISSLGHGCDEEAKRIVMGFKFQVERTRKRRVTFHKTIQIHFRLPKVKTKPVQKKNEIPKQVSTSINYSYTTIKSSPPPQEKEQKSIVYTYKVNVKK